MRTRVAWVFLACLMLAGCGGGETAPREGPTDERAGSGPERTFSGTVPEGVTVGRTTVDRPSPEERGRSEASLIGCQFEEAEADLGREGLDTLVLEMTDELIRKAGRALRAASRRARLHVRHTRRPVAAGHSSFGEATRS